MSEHLLKVFLSELSTVRVCCQNAKCQGIIEFDLERWDRMFSAFGCPLCKETFCLRRDDQENYIKTLRTAIWGLKQAADKLAVEFVIPIKEQKQEQKPKGRKGDAARYDESDKS